MSGRTQGGVLRSARGERSRQDHDIQDVDGRRVSDIGRRTSVWPQVSNGDQCSK